MQLASEFGLISGAFRSQPYVASANRRPGCGYAMRRLVAACRNHSYTTVNQISNQAWQAIFPTLWPLS
jgi:hypothetical protein